MACWVAELPFQSKGDNITYYDRKTKREDITNKDRKTKREDLQKVIRLITQQISFRSNCESEKVNECVCVRERERVCV